jgi:hypothetical protein
MVKKLCNFSMNRDFKHKCNDNATKKNRTHNGDNIDSEDNIDSKDSIDSVDQKLQKQIKTKFVSGQKLMELKIIFWRWTKSLINRVTSC